MKVKALNEEKQLVDIYSKNYDYIIKNTDSNDLDLTRRNGTIFSNAYFSKIAKSYERVEKVANKICSKSGFGCWYNRILPITTFQQQNGYYCGPANIKQVVHYINGSSSSQDTYAWAMETSPTSGTTVVRMTNQLNGRQTYNSYVARYMQSSEYSVFLTIVKGDLFYGEDPNIKGIPVVLHAWTGSLYMYNGNYIGHYLTINGYYSGTNNITYVDSFYENYGRGSLLGQHTDTGQQFLTL